MEVALIDWKRIDSRYVKDEVYEHINAPQWVDLASPDDPVDDEAWFCRPECNHPKTVDDFLSERTPTPKRLASVSEVRPLGERNWRDATLKKRGLVPPSILSNKDSRTDKIVEDSENQNPNFTTPPNYKSNKFMKEAFKSSADKKAVNDDSSLKEQMPSLRRTLSARNLFAGGDILNKITEFCSELKKLAVRAKEKENQEDKECFSDDLRDIDDKEKERTPLLEIAKGKGLTTGNSRLQEKQRRKIRYDDTENTPISIDVKNAKHKDGSLIRTNPPTPQCFSASRVPADAANPPKVFRSRPLERGILEELGQSNKEEKKDNDDGNKGNHHVRRKQASITAEKEAKALDVFWFLKPCTLSS